MIFDGKQFAEDRRKTLLEERKGVGDISLGIVMSADDPITSSFVKIKEKNAEMLGVKLVRHTIPEDADTEVALSVLKQAEEETGIIVQLPLPKNVDVERVLGELPKEKDVDALSPEAVTVFEEGGADVIPPVAKAIKEIIEKNDLEIKGKKVIVVGKGKLVGAPALTLMKNLGGNVIALEAGDDVSAETKDADIIVLGAGQPGLLKKEMVKEGVVVFDAGTSESGGMVVGDAEKEVGKVASFFTPVPGGIGPVAVVEIFANLLALKKG